MCLILVAWQAHPDFPLVVAANRDEFFARRAVGADFWGDAPSILAGRDLEAGGTWLGIARGGPHGYKFSVLTNYRDPGRHKQNAPSRGSLVADFLRGDMSIDAYLDRLHPADYNGFNLLLGDGRRLVAYSNVAQERHELGPGIYGLSNHLLDTPWPKVGAGKTALTAALAALPDEAPLFRLLRDDRIHPDDRLPATGVPLEWERLLSAAFIRSPDYGTRCSTVVKVGAGPVLRARGAINIGADRTATFDEQTWLPGGTAGERRRFRFPLERA
jgi:uncharacterized protein with NRDE domain